MKLSDLIIDPRSLGSRLWLVDITPYYEYKASRKTDKVAGYRYVCAMPERSLEKIGVKISGVQQMDIPASYVDVGFLDLELYVYWSNGQPEVGARASGIYVIHDDDVA